MRKTDAKIVIPDKLMKNKRMIMMVMMVAMMTMVTMVIMFRMLLLLLIDFNTHSGGRSSCRDSAFQTTLSTLRAFSSHRENVVFAGPDLTDLFNMIQSIRG